MSHSRPPNNTHRPPRPSPLANVHFTRPISLDPTMGLVRDPKFWKRFSTAVHQTEAAQIGIDVESGKQGQTQQQASLKSRSTFDIKEGDDWLSQQRKEKRKCRFICAFITLAIILVIIAAIVVWLWFTKWKN